MDSAQTAQPINLSPAPLLMPIKVLRPTQMTVGMREVSTKRHHLRAKLAHLPEIADAGEPLEEAIPVVYGPGDSVWMLDHHHFARALYEEGESQAPVQVVAQLAHLSKRQFFTVMDCRNWLHPYDANGKRCALDALPRHVGKLVDDPFRSLAYAVRRAGGFGKTTLPYAEFLWADYFRGGIRRHHVEAKFDKMTIKAIALARDEQGAYLPGWLGRASTENTA